MNTSGTINLMGNFARVVIAGGPRTGKTTLALDAGAKLRFPVRHSDALIQELADENFPVKDRWSEASLRASRWLDVEGRWIIEGVAMPRAIRKWFRNNPDRQIPIDAVVWLGTPVVPQTDKHRSMHEGCMTVWKEILPQLWRHAVKIIEPEGDAIEVTGWLAR